MGDPTTTNQTAAVVNGILKNLISGVGLDAVEAAAIVELPWLGWPIIKQIFELVLSKIAALIYEQAAYAATKIIIDVQVGIEESKVGPAFESLQMAIASGDQNAIALASKDLDKAYGDLIHFDGWSSP